MARTRTQNTLTAAAVRIDTSNKKLAVKHMKPAADWQDEVIAYGDTVPELKQSLTYVGNQLAKLVLQVGWMPPGATEPMPLSSEDVPPQIAALKADAEAEVARLRGEFGGQGAILNRMARNLDGPGECYLVGWAERPDSKPMAGDGTPESWQCCSIKELVKKSGKWTVMGTPDDRAGRVIEDGKDTVIRIWEQDATWVALPTSSMKGVLGEAKILQVLSQQVLAQAMRAASNGFFTIPNELSQGGATPVEPEDGDEATVDPFIQQMDDVFMGPLDDPSNPASVQPGLIRGEGKWLHPDFLRHITFWSKEVDDALDAKIEARVGRIARGINLPVEVVKGLEATTFANAEQVDTDVFEDFLQPRCDLIVEGLTIGYLRPNLVDAGKARDLVEQLVVMYDASAIISQPDTEKNADQAWNNGVISDAAYRKAKGFDEADAPTPLELVIRFGLKRGIFTAELTGAMIQKLADEAGVELPDLAPAPPDGAVSAAAQNEVQARVLASLIAATSDDPAEREEAVDWLRAHFTTTTRPRPVIVAATSRAAARTPNAGVVLRDIDRDLRTRLIVAADSAMTRALEKAGNRLRSKAVSERALLRNVPAHLCFATLGTRAETFVTADEALGDAWEELERQFMAWGASAQADALGVAARAAGGFTAAQTSAYKAKQADDLADAWSWFKGSMTAAASGELFDPTNVAVALGEFDATLKVPVGMVRQALARAGGATGLTTSGEGSGFFVTLADGGTRPAGGIGTGELLREAMRDHGVAVEAYEWTYGAGRRTVFEPHQQLDGVQFASFDDPVLANDYGWPSVAFFLPGDHNGCVCDFTPILLSPDEARAAGLALPDGITDDDDEGA